MRDIAITSNSFFTLIMQARIIAHDHNLNREETFALFCGLSRQASMPLDDYLTREAPIGHDEDILF